MSSDYHATIGDATVAGLLVQAAKVAVAEWPRLTDVSNHDYHLDRLTRTVAETLLALAAGDVERARVLIDVVEDQYIDGFVHGLVLTDDEPFSDSMMAWVAGAGAR
jgi:hypothetical protein